MSNQGGGRRPSRGQRPPGQGGRPPAQGARPAGQGGRPKSQGARPAGQGPRPSGQGPRRDGPRRDSQRRGGPSRPAPAPVPRTERDVALAAVLRVEEGAYANLVLPPLLAGSELRPGQRAAATDLVYGSVRLRGALDHALTPLSKQGLDRLEPLVLWGLRLGAYELLFSRTAAHAAVGETVAAVRRAGSAGQGGYVNAVLRRLAADTPKWPDPARDPLGWATTRGSHPEWIAREALTRLGPAGLIELAEADNARPAVTLRATPGRTTVARLIAELAEAGIQATPTALSPDCLVLAGGDPGALDCVRDGRAVVQDEASALIAPLLGAGPGDLVADLAAGPGGKAGHAAALGARVTAVELHPSRAALVAETADRIDVADHLDVVIGDATRSPLRQGAFDAVLLDAPCTNLGSLRRRPEARWRHSPDEIDGLVRLQGRLLDAAALAVRPGGTVVYSVCTWTRAETEDVLTAARSRLPQLVPAPLGGPFGEATSRQLWTHRDGTDGIFVARFTRRG
jgi:16S rRNA (cytosine967-C5)-methyltransferase